MALGLDARATFLAVVKGDVSDAVGKFDKLGKSVDKSTGQSTSTIGKFKAFGKGAMAELGASTATLAATAAASFAALAADGARAFVELGKKSLDLARATGLTVEEASRWIEVAGDYGVEADALQTSIGKLNRTLTPEIAAKYGIALKDAAGNARSSSDIFLDAIVLLNETPDAGLRARRGTELLGRGWQSLAPILGKSRAQYEDMLDSVKEGMVITEEEAQKSEELRLALDDLSDSWESFKLGLGEAVAEGAPVLKFLGDMLGYVDDIEQRFYTPFEAVSDVVRAFSDDGNDAADSIKTTGDMLIGLGGESPTSGISMARSLVVGLGEDAYDTAWEIKGISDRFAGLLGQIDERQALRNIKDDFDELKTLAAEAYAAGVEGADDAEQKNRDYQRALDDLRVSGIGYADMLGNIPPTKVTEFLTLVDQQKFDEAEALLNSLATGRVVGFQPRIVFGRGGGIGGGGQIVLSDEDFPGMATGGPVSANMPYMVGERGPELFMPATSGTIIPNNALGGGNVTVIINNPVSSGEQIANELAAYVRRNGTRFLTGVS